MWQGHISEHEQGFSSEAAPCKSSTLGKISDEFANLTL